MCRVEVAPRISSIRARVTSNGGRPPADDEPAQSIGVRRVSIVAIKGTGRQAEPLLCATSVTNAPRTPRLPA